MTACTSQSTDGAARSDQDGKGRAEPAAVVAPPKVEATPANGQTNVSPIQPVKVTVSDGTISSVALTNESGKHVKGRLAADGHSWQVTEPLGYGKTYTWSGVAANKQGKQTKITGKLSTVTPQAEVGGQLNVGDNQTYGVAMPIVLTFDSPVSDKAAVEKQLSVRTSNQTEGSWAWLDDYSVHYRPKHFWQPGTNVKVSATLYGVKMGGGAYGASDLSSLFTIGANQTVKANTASHYVTVYRSGKKIAVYPASFGLDSDPGRVTHSGTHVVMSKSSSYSMSNPAYGYENVVVQWAVRISNNGEFIHAYPGSIYAQGNTNVSHGCINLSTENGEKYFNFAQIGDPVEVVGSSQKLSPQDGDYYDWTLNWNTWKSKSAL
jgi:lipoprotein-anchoring transpeptidase ErfK/SrfK